MEVNGCQTDEMRLNWLNELNVTRTSIGSLVLWRAPGIESYGCIDWLMMPRQTDSRQHLKDFLI